MSKSTYILNKRNMIGLAQLERKKVEVENNLRYTVISTLSIKIHWKNIRQIHICYL